MADRPYFDANGLPASAAPPAAARAQDREEIEKLAWRLVEVSVVHGHNGTREPNIKFALAALLSAFDRAREEARAPDGRLLSFLPFVVCCYCGNADAAGPTEVIEHLKVCERSPWPATLASARAEALEEAATKAEEAAEKGKTPQAYAMGHAIAHRIRALASLPAAGAADGAREPSCDDCGLTRVPFWFHAQTGRRTCLDCTKKRDALAAPSPASLPTTTAKENDRE
jgi:hypothetical protein